MNYPTNHQSTVLSTGPNFKPYVVLRLAWSDRKTAYISAFPKMEPLPLPTPMERASLTLL
jgi:hypothetical protein